MKMMKKVLTSMLCAALTVSSAAFAAGEFLIDSFNMEKGLKNCPYHFTNGEGLSDWTKFGGSGSIDSGNVGALKVNYESNGSTKWTCIYTQLSDGNFTADDMGTYKITYKIKTETDKYSGASLSPNQWSRKVYATMPKLDNPDADGWTTIEQELTIDNSNKSAFSGKPVILMLVVAESSNTQNDVLDAFVFEMDDIVVTKEDTSGTISGQYIVTPKLLPKTVMSEGTFGVSADIYADGSTFVTESLLDSFGYNIVPQFSVNLGESVFDAELYITEDSEEASDKVKLKRFFRNGQNLISDSGFESSDSLWTGGSVTSAQARTGSKALETAANGSICYDDSTELLKAFGQGEYLLEAWVYSSEPCTVSAENLSEGESWEVQSGEWTYVSFQLSSSEISSDGKSFSVKLNTESTAAVYFDNITLKKILDY